MALHQFTGPTGVITVGDDLAAVYRKTPGYAEIVPDAEPAPQPEPKASASKEK